MKYRVSDRSPEFQKRWNEVFSHEWGIWNLATFFSGRNRCSRKTPSGEIVDDSMFRVRKTVKGEIGMAMSVLEVRCSDCRIAEPDGVGGFYCPEKNKEFHGDAGSVPRKCNYFQRREDELEIAEVDDQAEEIDGIPEEPKRKKTMAEIAAMGREALRKKREEMKKGIQEKVVEKRAKAGGNGKVKIAPKPVELAQGASSPVEQAFEGMKKSKMERLKELLLSFTVAELIQMEMNPGLDGFGEEVLRMGYRVEKWGKKVA